MSSGPRTEQLSMQDAAPSPVGGLGVVFLVAQPGLETALLTEAIAAGFADAQLVPGGVEIAGGLAEAIRANHILRRAVRVLWRVAAFRALHLAQLDKRAKKLAWLDWLRPDQPVRVEAVCRSSKIYHDKAAVQRIAGAITAAGITVASDATLVIKARIEDDLCTISIDTSGEPLHRRGHKTFVGKAPLRETMAAGFLWQMGFDGGQAVVDPMCGSGTIVLEAAEIAAGLLPGRSRDFAFAHLVGGGNEGRCPSRSPGYLENEEGGVRFFGYDRDDGAIRGAQGNAARAGTSAICHFTRQAVSDLMPPEGIAPGIILTNPPYGARIGERKLLFAVYGALGATLRARFAGWKVGIVTPDKGLAQATGLSLAPLGPVDHSGTKVWLWQGVIG